MAGGTGGHVFPALAVAEHLRELGMQVCWMGTRRGLEARVVPARGFPMEWIRVEGVRGVGAKRLLAAPVQILRALWQALGIMRRRRPSVVLGMGGFASGPGGLMARALGIPLVIHEQNRIAGLTNQWLARIATRVFEAFPGSFPKGRGAEACGNPVRLEIARLEPPGQRFAGRQGPLRLLVVGGSLGAQALNQTVPQALAQLPPEHRPLVRHQSGDRNLEEARAAYRQAGVSAELLPFIEDMAAAYAWADLVLCRAGALTISELAAAGLGAILVPYPYAVDDHQTRNAEYLVDAGAARLVPQRELTASGLSELLRPLLEDRRQVLAMAQAARGKARLDAVERIAEACREVQRR
jgi:UDP-N-acetylglucosamine--N-acetylmuramyl-(pentapeptide) pyrophosphoryl-undecaprenol N-acetylglucosamine transferase